MSKIKFIDKTHQYLTEENKELISVSKFTDRFKEKTDWSAVAAHVAKKLTKEGTPTSQKEILAKWKNKRDKSSEIGTIYHSIRENELLSQEKPLFYKVPCETKQCETVGEFKYSIPINELSNNTVYVELMIYDLENMICGQADKVIVAGNKINVWDYKTDSDISTKAYSSKWQKGKKLLPPLSHLDDCDINYYSIKMSLYMYLLWKANRGRFKPGELIIEHVHLKRDPENDDIPILLDGKPVVQKIETLYLPYRKKEVMDMLKTI